MPITLASSPGRPGQPMFIHYQRCWRAFPLAVTLFAAVVPNVGAQTQPLLGQVSPGGYWGAINTPTADVIPTGEAGVALTSSNPELRRTNPEGSFGSLNAGAGLLPGLEGVARLAYEGDLNCNLFDTSVCSGGLRDLSMSAKYQLPWRLPLDTRLAFGATDFGGAATRFRLAYGVATSSIGPVDLSLGYSRASSRTALIDGTFGSAAWRLTEHFTALIENDSQQWRGGVLFRHRLTDHLDLQLAASRKLTDPTSGQQAWQMTAAVQVALEGNPHRESVAADRFAAAWVTLQAGPVGERTANGLARAIEGAGFAHVKVLHRPASGTMPALWQIQAEPRRWRSNHLDAAGAGLATWLATQGPSGADGVLLTLTYQRQPVLHVYTTAPCLRAWIRTDVPTCEGAASDLTLQDAGVFLSADLELPSALAERLQMRAGDAAQAGADRAWMPQIELSAQSQTRIGTEYGLFDYSLAAEVGAEVALAPGLFGFGTFTFPISHSRRFDDDEVFGKDRLAAVGFDAAMLSYWKPLPHRLALQASAGYLDRDHLGGQLDGRWVNASGRLRASAQAGLYRQEDSGVRRKPLLGSLRYSLLPGSWQVEATAGRFLNGDHGAQLASLHWRGDILVKFVYTNSQGAAGSALAARRELLGFTVSLPLGPRAAQPVGATWVRGPDRLAWTLKTKVGEKDNRLISGYAEAPTLRHGLDREVSDFDRNGAADLAARAGRVREALVETLTGSR